MQTRLRLRNSPSGLVLGNPPLFPGFCLQESYQVLMVKIQERSSPDQPLHNKGLVSRERDLNLNFFPHAVRLFLRLQPPLPYFTQEGREESYTTKQTLAKVIVPRHRPAKTMRFNQNMKECISPTSYHHTNMVSVKQQQITAEKPGRCRLSLRRNTQ